jgi:WhiB family redox-sensing transcriptional regulator
VNSCHVTTREVVAGIGASFVRVEKGTNMQDLMDMDDEGALGWQERALCAQTDPEAFFPEKGGSTREAKKVCLSCDVRGECLEYALFNDERFGIWGGLSERERRKLKKRAG